MLDSFINFLETTGVARLFASADWWKTAIMFVIAGIEPTNKQVAEDAILEQLDEMKNKKISKIMKNLWKNA